MVKTLTGHILRLLFPWACAGCRTPLETIDDSGFCGRCWLRISRIQGLVCRFCGIPLKFGGNLCFPCGQEPFKILVRAAADFSGPLQSAIHRFKYAGRGTLAHVFGVLLGQAWDAYPELQPVDAVVPVPLHTRTLYARGYNQAELLAQSIASRIGYPMLNPVLNRLRRTKPQFRLSKTQRLTNLQGAFGYSTAAFPIKGLRLLLVDDVCTSGATLLECAQTLKQAGAASVKALVLARDI